YLEGIPACLEETHRLHCCRGPLFPVVRLGLHASMSLWLALVLVCPLWSKAFSPIMTPKNPWIKITPPLPGPKAQAVLAQDRQFVSPSYSRPYPLVAAKAEGMVVTDMDGNTFLDFAAGIAVCATGHCHPRIVKVIQEQAT